MQHLAVIAPCLSYILSDTYWTLLDKYVRESN